MELFAVFETWHIGDGNYPALEKGQFVNLSFMVDLNELSVVEDTAEARSCFVIHKRLMYRVLDGIYMGK